MAAGHTEPSLAPVAQAPAHAAPTDSRAVARFVPRVQAGRAWAHQRGAGRRAGPDWSHRTRTARARGVPALAASGGADTGDSRACRRIDVPRTADLCLGQHLREDHAAADGPCRGGGHPHRRRVRDRWQGWPGASRLAVTVPMGLCGDGGDRQAQQVGAACPRICGGLAVASQRAYLAHGHGTPAGSGYCVRAPDLATVGKTGPRPEAAVTRHLPPCPNDLGRIREYCQAPVPARPGDQARIEASIRGSSASSGATSRLLTRRDITP